MVIPVLKKGQRRVAVTELRTRRLSALTLPLYWTPTTFAEPLTSM